MGSRHFVLDDHETSLDRAAEEALAREAALGRGLLFLAVRPLLAARREIPAGAAADPPPPRRKI